MVQWIVSSDERLERKRKATKGAYCQDSLKGLSVSRRGGEARLNQQRWREGTGSMADQ